MRVRLNHFKTLFVDFISISLYFSFCKGTGLNNCHNNGTTYEGYINVTFDGFPCLNWTLVRGKESMVLTLNYAQ